MAVQVPTSLQSGEDYDLKNPAKHKVYYVDSIDHLDYLTTTAASDTAPAIAAKITTGSGSFGNTASGLASSIVAYVSGGGAMTAKIHLLDGRRISPTVGTGASHLDALTFPEDAHSYANKKHLTFDFPAALSLGNTDTWTSAMRGEVYDWAWQELGTITSAFSSVAYVPSTGVFTWTIPAGSPFGRLHVWTY